MHTLNRRSRRLTVFVASIWLTSACAESSPGAPGGEADPTAPCDAGRSRLRGVCVNDCGGDPSQLDSEFAGDLMPVANLCEASLAGKPFAARSGGKAGSFTLVDAAAALGSGRVDVTLRFRTVMLASGKLGDAERCTLQHATPAPARIALHHELGLSPAGGFAHVILRELGAEVPDLQIGSIAYVLSRSCVITEHEPGPKANEAAIMLTEDPARLIVSGYMEGLGNGLFLGSQYVAQGVRPLRRYGDDGVLALSGSGHGAVWLTWLPARALANGPFPVAGLRSEGEEWPYEFVVVPGRGLVGDRPVAQGVVGEHWLFDIQHEGGRLFRQGITTRFASQQFTRVVPVEGSGLVVLEHERGLLVVE